MYAFCGCTNLRTVKIPEHITQSEFFDASTVFEGCSSLERFNLSGKELLMQIRRETKKKFKAGQLPVTEHQKACKDVENIKSEIRETKSNFIQEMEDETGVDFELVKISEA